MIAKQLNLENSMYKLLSFNNLHQIYELGQQFL